LAQPRLARKTRRSELHGKIELHAADEVDDLLQIVFGLAGHAQLLILDLCRDLELLVFDGFGEFLGAIGRDAFGARHDLAQRALRGRFRLAELQRFERNAALDALALQDVDHVLEFHLVVRDDRDRHVLEFDGRLRVFEVETRGDLARRLIHGIFERLFLNL
jgi:hypothetical protein